MITANELQRPITVIATPSQEDQLELSRLLAAAIVNPSFCHLLLVDPELAIKTGYQDENFALSDSARYLLSFIHVDTLPEMAQQIAQSLSPGALTQSLTFAPAPDFIGT